MAEIRFSLIGEVTLTMRSILDDFEARTGHRVVTQTSPWETAWHQLLMWALYEESPHVSHVGSTWVTSLVGMNVLRPFSELELRSMGGQIAFLPQAWQSIHARGSSDIWAMPWSTYTFILAYRRDLLARAGIDESTAFATHKSLVQTLATLRTSGVQHPWVVPVSKTHLDTLHYVASWVWGSGGHFTTEDGRHVAFNQPQTIKAITDFFALLQYMKKPHLPLDESGAISTFIQGDAAVTIAGAGAPYEWINNHLISDDLAQNIGFAPMPGTPWLGGDHLVIWKQARISSQIENGALELVRTLVSLEGQQRHAKSEDVGFPSRPDAFDALPLPGSSLTETIANSLRNGRSYRSVPNWSKIEFEFAKVFGNIGELIFNGAAPDAIIRKELDSLALWLDVSLR